MAGKAGIRNICKRSPWFIKPPTTPSKYNTPNANFTFLSGAFKEVAGFFFLVIFINIANKIASPTKPTIVSLTTIPFYVDVLFI